MKKLIRLLALLLLVILCVSACNGGGNETDNTGNDTKDTTENTKDTSDTSGNNNNGTSDTKDTEKVETLAEADALVLSNKKRTDYFIVEDDAAPKAIKNAISKFATAFATKTGSALETRNDSEAPKEKEILIYLMDDRDEVQTVFEKITAPEKKGFRIEAIGSKIVVACNDEMYLEYALDLLGDAIRVTDTGSYGIEKDYVGMLDIPALPTAATSTVNVKYTASGNQTVAVNMATKNNYSNFVRSLASNGFTTYATNTIGDAQFGTYIKESQFGQQAVYTRYFPEDSCYKVTYGPLGYLPEIRAAASDKVTPSFTQMQLTSGVGAGTAPGMSTVVQCSDGKYIIFDGGSNKAADKETLYNFLKDNDPDGGKPTIAAWVITHAHGDHMGLANSFLAEYVGKIELERIVYNFPDWENVSLSYEGSVSGSEGIASQFQAIVESEYSNAQMWVAHAGEVLNLPGVEMEVLYTQEDYATGFGLKPNGSVVFGSANSTNVITRLTINGTTVMMLGDSMPEENKWMANNYGDYLKSDMLQLAHHGSNGGEITLYQAIDPDICIWPVEAERMEEFKSNSEFNRYLASLGEYSSGRKREHYSHDTITTFDCTDDGPVVREQK